MNEQNEFTVTQLPSGRVECVFGEHKVSAGTDVEAFGLMREVLAEMECPSGGCGLAARAVADSRRGENVTEEEIREGYRVEKVGYEEEVCGNCDRQRVELCVNGKRICEKCHWDQDSGEYDGWHMEFFG